MSPSEPAVLSPEAVASWLPRVCAAIDGVNPQYVAQLDAAKIDLLVAAVIRLFRIHAEESGSTTLSGTSNSVTDALTLVTAILQAHDINSFDLALWMSHSAAPGPGAHERP